MTGPPRATARLPLALLVLAPVLLAAARPAWALCPNCLGQQATLTPTMRIVGVFLLVPPAVFFFVARLVRRLGR
ncbi:MAG TPA: hypothetical protein VGK52_14375 [Polyangia bacterium]